MLYGIYAGGLDCLTFSASIRRLLSLQQRIKIGILNFAILQNWGLGQQMGIQFKRVSVVFPVMALWWAGCSVFAQLNEKQRITIPLITDPIDFDGQVNDKAWDKLTPLPLVMHAPTFGKEPSEASQIFICHTHDYIYVGARLYDSDPSGILSTSKKRDEISETNDWFTVLFDSFNDKENAMAFATTPSGLRSDYTVFKDGLVQLPQMPFNISWNTFWDVLTSRDEQGWYVEMRIPMTSMRFKETGGKVVMGFTCFRQIARKNEIDIYPAISPEWGFFSIFRPSQAAEVEFPELKSQKAFYIAPYALAGYKQENLLNQAETAYDLHKNPVLNGGLDLKYGLTNNLTLDVTLNTDFAQVEADDEQVNLTRFSLFFKEKRSFFQERSSIFSFDFDEGNSLFYSRTIGLSGGEQVPIYGGVRITGMAGKWDLGLLNMQTRRFDSDLDEENDLPSENFGILRLRRNILNENSYIGAMAVSRIGAGGFFNVAYGADATLRVVGDDYLNIKIAQTIDDSSANRQLSFNPTQVYVNWSRVKTKGLTYGLTYSRSGENFNPESGFRMRENYTLANVSLGYGWIRDEEASVLNDGLHLNIQNYLSNDRKELESFIGSAGYFGIWKSGFIAYIGYVYQVESVADSFEFADQADMPPGLYRFQMAELHGSTAESKRFFFGWDGFAGSFFDGYRFSAALQPSWNISPSFQTSVVYGFDRLWFDRRNQNFTGHLFRLRALFMASTRLSFSSFLQYNQADHQYVANFRLHFNPREGNDFYVVYNEGRNTELGREVPHLPAMGNRTFLVKYTYTFSIRR